MKSLQQANSGGSYIKDKDGKATKVAGTVSHADGDRPRDADGNELRKSKKMQAQRDNEKSAMPEAKTQTASKASTKKGEK